MAEYADVVSVSAAILQRAGIPAMAQGFWTEHSERSVLITGLSVLGVTGPEKDLLGRWKPEGSDTYARSYGAGWRSCSSSLLWPLEKTIDITPWTRGRSLAPWLSG